MYIPTQIVVSYLLSTNIWCNPKNEKEGDGVRKLKQYRDFLAQN